MYSLPKYTSIIFDIGDVLFTWSPQTNSSISPQLLRKMLTSPTWFQYECGQISQDVCYSRLGQNFSLDPSDIDRAFEQARDSLQANDGLFAVIRRLKQQSEGQLRIFIMSNVSQPDYEVLRAKDVDWSIFDKIYTSAGVGERKPNLGFYRTVLSKTGIDPLHTIFVDDKPENVLSARSFGMHGIVFDDVGKVIRALHNLLGDPVRRGQNYLKVNAKHHDSVTNEGVVLRENFAQLLILDATRDKSLVHIDEQTRIWNFYQGKPPLITEVHPFNLDTTALGVTVLKYPKDVADSVMDVILEYVDNDGITQTYFDHQRPHIDPVVCVNTLTLFYSYQRGYQLGGTLNWVREVLLHRAYLDGTRYYVTSECFLYFLGRLLETTKDSTLINCLRPLLKERIRERIGVESDAPALAMRLLTCAYLNINNEVDLHALLAMQCEDGGWENGWIYKYSYTGIVIGNRGLTTALAVKAIQLHATHSATSPLSVTRHSRFLHESKSDLTPLRRPFGWLWGLGTKALL